MPGMHGPPGNRAGANRRRRTIRRNIGENNTATTAPSTQQADDIYSFSSLREKSSNSNFDPKNNQGCFRGFCPPSLLPKFKKNALLIPKEPTRPDTLIGQVIQIPNRGR